MRSELDEEPRQGKFVAWNVERFLMIRHGHEMSARNNVDLVIICSNVPSFP